MKRNQKTNNIPKWRGKGAHNNVIKLYLKQILAQNSLCKLITNPKWKGNKNRLTCVKNKTNKTRNECRSFSKFCSVICSEFRPGKESCLQFYLYPYHITRHYIPQKCCNLEGKKNHLLDLSLEAFLSHQLNYEWMLSPELVSCTNYAIFCNWGSVCLWRYHLLTSMNYQYQTFFKALYFYFNGEKQMFF